VVAPNQDEPSETRASTQGADPFASFETSGPETVWEQEQTRKSVEFLHARRNFDEMVRRVREYRNQALPPKQVELRGRIIFSLEEATPSSGMAILRRDGKSAPTVLFRIENDPASRRMEIDFMAVSRSGNLVAVGISEAGTEETLVRVFDARTGKELGDRSHDVQLQQLAWLPDDSGYIYLRGRGSKNVSVQDRIRDISVALHTLGQPEEHDVEVVGARAPGKRIHGDFQDPYPYLSPDGRDVFVRVKRGVNPDSTVFWKKRDGLLDGKSEWQRLYDEFDRVKNVAVRNGRIVVIRSTTDDEYVLEELTLGPMISRRVLYTSKNPLEDVVCAGANTYFVERQIATKHLFVVGENGQVAPVALPAGTSVWPEGLRVDPSTNKLVVDLRSWSGPPTWWTVAEGRKIVDPIWPSRSTSKTDAYDVRILEATARDGERIPLTVVGPKGVAPRFVWVVVYGAYGTVYGPSFTPVRHVFFESGGTFVFAHVRGGGEKGRLWHEQGRGPNKIKTVEDTIDSVKFLRSAGFGKDGGIILSGGSAGGIPAGGLLVREPDIVDAVFIDIGIVNVSRMEAAASATGAIHRQEFGSDDTPEGARQLRPIDAYLNIRDGRPYPATLLRAGVNDVRVPRWQSSKFVARLQQATASTKPILLRLTGGGHGAGNTRDEGIETDAELLTFALSNLRHPEFQ